MPTVPVLNQQGQPAGEIVLADEVFAADLKPKLLAEVVRYQMARKRCAHPTTRNRAQVSGGGKKPYRQKGTGRARQGSFRAPHFRGGGVVFGPNGRKYTFKLNKKVRKAALRAALSLRLSQDELIVLDDLQIDEPKTKRFARITENLSSPSALFVVKEHNEHLLRSSRNIPKVKVMTTEGLNVYDILRHPRLVITKPAIEGIEERLKQ